MKKASTFFTLMAIALGTQAQVVLTKASVPPAGTIYIRKVLLNPSFNYTAAASGNAWDFEQATGTAEKDDSTFYVSPATVAGGTEFPTADRAMYKNTDKYANFVKVEDNGVYLQGLYGDVTGLGTPLKFAFATPQLLSPFPFSSTTQYALATLVNEKKSGLEVGLPIIDSGWAYIRKKYNVQAIGTGTVTLPTGAEPAILVKEIITTIDSSKIKASGMWNFFTPPSTVTDTSFKWYLQSSLEPYAVADVKGNKLKRLAVQKSADALGLLSFTTPAAKLTSYPNPAANVLYLDIDQQKVESVTLVAVSGEEVARTNTFNGSLDVSQLKSGMYAARILLKNGNTMVSSFLKQ